MGGCGHIPHNLISGFLLICDLLQIFQNNTKKSLKHHVGFKLNFWFHNFGEEKTTN